MLETKQAKPAAKAKEPSPASPARAPAAVQPGWLQLALAPPASDPLEREADAVADAVAGPPAGGPPGPPGPRVQRCAACGGKEKLQAKGLCESCARTPEGALRTLGRSGEPLADHVRSSFEARLGADFGNVRVHTGPDAEADAQSLGARAFTYGNRIAFGRGEYNPTSRAGRHLLAHELTHVVQQGAAGRRVQRQHTDTPPPPVPVATDEIRTSVDTIVDRLEGITSAWDSTDILNVFLRHDGAGCRSIMTELKARGPTREDPMSGAAMVEWLFGDMNVEDARTLRDYLIEHNVVDDVTPTVVAEIVDVLDSVFGSGTRVLELFGLYMRSGGPGADFLLTELQTQTRQTQEQMAVVLFDGLDRVSAWRLARMFYQGGGPLAIDYAARWNAAKIADLLEGWTTRTDSDSIVANFELVPQPLRAYVLTLVDAHTQPDRSAEDALMHDMTQGDYERLIVLGVPLRAYEPQHEGVLGTIGAGAEWVADWAVVLTEWVVCGAIGIFTGLLSAVWDILRSIVDIGLAIRDVLGMIAYFVSGGSIGSGSWLRVKEFFTGIGHAFSNAGQVWDAFWEDQRLQFRTLQGPLADCRRAELLVREVVNGIATIALILFAGYGLVKAGAAAIRALSEFAALVREVGWIEALSRVGAGARELAQLRAGLTIAELGELVSSLSRPGETLNVLRTTITDLVLAARNEGYWRFLRTRAVAAARRQIAQEGEWWREWGNRRGTWEEGALRYERRRAELEERLRVLREQAAASGRPPEQRDVTTAQDDTDRLQREVDQLNEEMTGERRTEQQPPPQEGQTPPVAAAAAEALTPLQRTIASEVQSILGSSEFAEVRNAQQAGRSVEVAVNGRTIIYQPDMPRPYYAMTLQPEGFVLGPAAFDSQEDLIKTLLHELHRLHTSASLQAGVGGALATQETADAFAFAEQTYARGQQLGMWPSAPTGGGPPVVPPSGGGAGGRAPLPAGRALLIGPERADEFAWADDLRTRGLDVTAVNPSATTESQAFAARGGRFVQGQVENLPAGEPPYTVMREDYPFPLGRAFPATQEFLRPRAERLAPGGIYSLITDDQDFATTLQAAADMRGDLEVTRYAPPAAHEGTPQSPWLRSRTRDILIFRKR